jgi:hypothetical protein
MARVAPKLRTSLVSRAAACAALGICETTFSAGELAWKDVFTDPRSPERRRPRVRRLVYEDELATAVEAGGGTEPRAKAAVLAYRDLIGRRAA